MLADAGLVAEGHGRGGAAGLRHGQGGRVDGLDRAVVDLDGRQAAEGREVDEDRRMDELLARRQAAQAGDRSVGFGCLRRGGLIGREQGIEVARDGAAAGARGGRRGGADRDPGAKERGRGDGEGEEEDGGDRQPPE